MCLSSHSKKFLNFSFFVFIAFLHNANRELSSSRKDDRRNSSERKISYEESMIDMKDVKKSLAEKDSKKEYYSTISDASSSIADDVTCSCGRSSVMSSSPSVSRSCSASGSPSNSDSESGMFFFCLFQLSSCNIQFEKL